MLGPKCLNGTGGSGDCAGMVGTQSLLTTWVSTHGVVQSSKALVKSVGTRLQVSHHECWTV